MNPREYLWVGLRAIGVQLHLAARHFMTAALQNQNHVVGGTATCTGEHHFHRTRCKIITAALGRAVHRSDVAAAGTSHEQHAFGAAPVDGALHKLLPDWIRGMVNDNTGGLPLPGRASYQGCLRGGADFCRYGKIGRLSFNFKVINMVEHSSNVSHSGFVRRSNPLEDILSELGRALQVLDGSAQAGRPNPAGPKPLNAAEGPKLSAEEQRHAAGLMRVNHVGEICAQALYRGQAMFCRDAAIRDVLHEAAAEEVDHLVWCNERLEELDSRPSLLNPLWYLGSFSLG